MDDSRGHEATTGHDATGPRRFSYTLDISGWPGGNDPGSLGIPTSEMGEGVGHLEARHWVEVLSPNTMDVHPCRLDVP